MRLYKYTSVKRLQHHHAMHIGNILKLLYDTLISKKRSRLFYSKQCSSVPKYICHVYNNAGKNVLFFFVVFLQAQRPPNNRYFRTTSKTGCLRSLGEKKHRHFNPAGVVVNYNWKRCTKVHVVLNTM